jgi:hypothetical protein
MMGFFDAAKVDTDVATLYSVVNDGPRECQVQMFQSGLLKQVNEACTKMDQEVLAKQTRQGKMQGLVLFVCKAGVWSIVRS